MIHPLQTDFNFLYDVARARRDPDVLHLWWLGRSGFLIHWQARHLLLNPCLSDISEQELVATSAGASPRIVEPERLDFADVVASSSDLVEHLDPDTLTPLLGVNPHFKLIIPEVYRSIVVERIGIDPWLPLGLEDGSSVTVAGFKITGISPGEALMMPGPEDHTPLGYVVQAGPWTIYHGGDTESHEGLADKLKEWSIDVAFLPYDGGNPATGAEVAALASRIGVRLAIPCHYGTAESGPEWTGGFAAECERLGQPYALLKPGERWSTAQLEGE